MRVLSGLVSSHGAGLATLLANMATEASVIFLPLFATELGASRLQVGIIGGAYGVAFLLSSLAFSRRADVKGRLPLVRVGLGLGTLAFAVQTIVGDPFTLMLARALVGFCLGISSAALMAYNYEMGAGTGRFASFGSLGWLLAAVVALFLQSYHRLFLFSSVSCGLAFAISLPLRENGSRFTMMATTLEVVRRNFRLYFSFFLRHLGANMVWVVFPLFLASLGASKAWIAVISGINTGGQFIAMMLVEKLRESRLFRLGLVLSVLVFLAYSQVTRYTQVMPVQLLLAVAWSCLYVGVLLLLLKKNEERATSVGFLFSVISLTGAVGPFLGGLVAQFWGYSMLMYIAAGLCVAGLGIATMRGRRSAAG
jgi:MFS family permease